jgi:FMN-dependent NADH-azoreductase
MTLYSEIQGVRRPVCLHIEASPRGGRSTSTARSRAFLDELTRLEPRLVGDRLPLWEAPLPEFDGATIAAKYARLAGKSLSAEEERAWTTVSHLVDGLRRADAVVISTPMWNMGIPYKLKHWIDLITQPGLSFKFDPETGYSPLLEDRPVLIVLSSAGDFSSGINRGRPDLATPYLTAAFRFIGFKTITIVPVAPTVGPEYEVTKGRQIAEAQLRALAPGFLERHV